MKGKIFITGGAGLVGTDVLHKLAYEEHEIIALYRKTKSIARQNIQWIQGDIGDTNIDLRRYLDSSSILIHNAAEINKAITPEEKRRIQLSNIDFTQKLFDWAAECGVQKIILTSGLSSPSQTSAVITEDGWPRLDNFYTASKCENEKYLIEKAAKFGIRYNILRLSSPVCFSLDRMPETVVKLWINKSLRKENVTVFGTGNRTQDFVATTDIANSFRSCISKFSVSGVFNIASGTALSMRELAELITSKFGNDIVYEKEDPRESERWTVSIEKARNDLGYLPAYSSRECIVKLLSSIK